MTIVLILAGAMLVVGALPVLLRMRASGVQVTLFSIAALAAGVFFGGGTVLSWALAEATGSAATPWMIDETHAATAAFAYLSYVTALALCSLATRGKFGAVSLGSIVNQIRETPDAIMWLLAGAVWAVRIYLVDRYAVVTPTTAPADILVQVPYGLRVAFAITTALQPLLVGWLSVRLFDRAFLGVGIMYFSVLMAEGLFQLMAGRRVLLFSGAIVLLTWNMLRRVHPIRLVATTAIFVTVTFSVGSAVYLRGRIVLERGSAPGGQALVQEYLEASVREGREGFGSRIRENVLRRSAAYLDWATEVAARRDGRFSLGGAGILADIRYVIPSGVLEDNKENMTWGEQTINQYYGIGRRDSPNSLAILGFADFSIGGSFLMGVLFACVLAGVGLCARHLEGLPPLGALVTLQGILMALSVETTLTGVLGVVRNLALLVVTGGAVVIIARGLRMGIARRPIQVITKSAEDNPA